MYTMYTWCVIFLAWDSLVVVGCLICRLQYQECHVWVFVLKANLRLVKSNTTTWIVNTFCCNLTSSHEIKRFEWEMRKGQVGFLKINDLLFLVFPGESHTYFCGTGWKVFAGFIARLWRMSMHLFLTWTFTQCAFLVFQF